MDRSSLRSPGTESQATLIAGAEDEPILWFRAPSARLARRAAAAEFYVKHAWRIRTAPRHMRPVACPDHPNGAYGTTAAMSDIERDEAMDNAPDTCRCGQVEEGWMDVCGPEWPDAVGCYQCEPRTLPSWCWKVRRALRRLHPGARHRWRPVLWGGRMERRATRLDRILVGRSIVNLMGDRWFMLGEGEWQVCATCERATPHRPAGPNYSGGRHHPAMCMADGHFDRHMALLTATHAGGART